jgi:hypothetical protein
MLAGRLGKGNAGGSCRRRAPQRGILPLQLPQPVHIMRLEPTKLIPPAVVGLLRIPSWRAASGP